jgi:adenosylcobinamide-GDP ribazoletransferase
VPLVMLPPARPEGAAASVGRPGHSAFGLAMALALVLSVFLSISAGAGSVAPLAGVATGLALVAAMAYWASRAIGGQTGDVAGACQQLAEIGFHVGVLAVMNGLKG